MLEIVQIPVLKDNYLFLVHDPVSGETAAIDPAVEDAVVEVLENRGWRLTHILNTHHHWDHIGANEALKNRFDLTIVGPSADRDRIPGLDIAVGDGDQVHLGEHAATVFDVPGHTRGHIAYHFAGANALFSGDVIFAMGCGRLFEGSPDQMWKSLAKLMVLPDETQIFCAHEYTEANGRFALTVDPENADLQARMQEVLSLRAKGKPTVPTTLGLEKATNPFLRPTDLGVQDAIGMVGAPPVAVFAELRGRKDVF